MSDRTPTPDDARIEHRRAQVRRWCAIGKRIGYGAILVAIVVFVIGVLSNFGSVAVGIIIGCLVLSGLTLIPATIFGYGVKMAEREERGEAFRY